MTENTSSLHGERIILRPITDADTDLIVRWRNNPEVRKNFIFRDKFTPQMHRKWMQGKVAKGDVVQFIIHERENDRPIGSVYYRDIDQTNSSAEYGIFIGENDARGKRYGTEAARLFVKFGFDTLLLHRISLRVLADNTQAYRSYEKVGFQYEGTAKDMVLLDGVYRDVIFMAILDSSRKTEESN